MFCFKYNLLICLLIFCHLMCFGCQEGGRAAAKPRAIVLWHGLGSDHTQNLRQLIRENIGDDVYIKSIQLGSNGFQDTESAIFIHPDIQIENICNQIADDVNLSNGFHAIGFSQGSQFLRGLIQRCESAKVINFISLGGQHEGIYGVPLCDERSYLPCQMLRWLLNYFAYTDWVQKHIAQATYWHDPLNEKKYRMKSSFLADINNEKKLNQNYIRRLHSLNKFVMVKFLRDAIVTPLETSWFGFYQPQSTSIVLSMSDYIRITGDKLGLRQMMQDGKIVFIEVDDGHVEFTNSWFINEIIPYLR